MGNGESTRVDSGRLHAHTRAYINTMDTAVAGYTLAVKNPYRFFAGTCCGLALLAAALSTSCSVPPVMIQADATCDELAVLYAEQRELWIVAAASPLGAPYRSSVRNELNRIEAAMTAKGCLMSVSDSPNSAAQEVPNEFLEEASASLYDAAPEQFATFVLEAEALASAAPNKSNAYNAAGVALFIAAPDEFVTFSTAWKVLRDAAPDEFAAIGTDQKVLYAMIPPEDYAKAARPGRELRDAAPDEFAAYNTAWRALRYAAPDEFAALANRQKVLYAAAPVQFTELDAASLTLYAAAPAEVTAFEYAGLQFGVLEALRLAAPQEFAAYMAAPADSEAEVDAFRALAAAAPDELAAAGTISHTLESISNALDSSK